MADNKNEEKQTDALNSRDRKLDDYRTIGRAMDILETLKNISDEEHPVSQTKINDVIEETTGKRINRGTLENTLTEIILALNPPVYSEEDDDKYRIKYNGYDDESEDKDLFYRKLKSEEKEEGKKSHYKTGLRYVHCFSMEEYHKLMEAVYSSHTLSTEEKRSLMQRIQSTVNSNYKSRFFNPDKSELKFDKYGIYSRIDEKERISDYHKNDDFAKVNPETEESISVIRKAIMGNGNGRGWKIIFRFRVYNEKGNQVSDDITHILSPFYIVQYHEFYYLIGFWDNSDKPSHYRIDLMTEVKILTDKRGRPVKSRLLPESSGLPQREEWNPEKYMSEHLHMFYDAPRDIKIKYRHRNNNYTMFHDWFGSHYKVSQCDEEGYSFVSVKTSPDAMVAFALQYSDRIEVMDEEIRQKIRERIELLGGKYGDKDI